MNPWKMLVNFLQGGEDDGDDRTLSEEACLKYAPVWNAVSKISAGVGMLPLNANKRLKKGGSEYAISHPAYRCMRSRPNDFQSAMVFRQTGMAHALLSGNFRCVIDRSNPSRCKLWPLPADSYTVFFEGKKVHIARKDPSDPTPIDYAMKVRDYDKLYAWWDEDVFHVMGLSLDGINGLKLSEFAAQSFGLGLSGEKQAVTQTRKGFNGSLFLQAPIGQFTREQDAQEFLKSFKEAHSGTENNGAIGLLRNGVTANAVSMSGRDQQALESRQFQRGDVSLWFLLEHITGDGNNSYASVEQRNIAYLQNGLGKWLKTWEEEADEKLRTEKEKEKDSIFFKFNTGALLRTDMQSTATTMSILRSAMVLTANECRDLLDYNPIDGGDTIENPATTSQKQADRPQSDTTESNAMQNRIAHMIGIECKRLINATSVSNYTDWVEKFYAGWENRFGNVIVELGGDAALAKAHCHESMEYVFHLLGYVQQDTLKAEIEKLVADWPNRAKKLTKQILEVEYV